MLLFHIDLKTSYKELCHQSDGALVITNLLHKRRRRWHILKLLLLLRGGSKRCHPGTLRHLQSLGQHSVAMADLTPSVAETATQLVDDDVTVAEQLDVKVHVSQRLAVDQDLRHVVTHHVWSERRVQRKVNTRSEFF